MIKEINLKKHLIIALFVGLWLRLLCAHFDYGPFALDDYLHGLIPAHLLVDNGIHELPSYRSWLIVWLLSFFLRVGELFGTDSALSKIRIMLYGLSVFSLIGVYGTYLYVRNFNNKIFQIVAIYLVAIYPLSILVSTRAFGETVAMAVILLGFGLCENARLRQQNSLNLIVGLLVLGVACLFRFHVALIWVSYAICLLIINWRRYLLPIIIGGILTLILQMLIDFESNRSLFETFISYLHVNEGGAAGYGVTPWYSTWLLSLAFILAPFSLPLFRNYRALIKSHWILLVITLVFIAIHSLVPHKEERFMFPIVGLELIILSALWSEELNQQNKLSKFFLWVLIVLGVPALGIICLVNFQSAAVDPLLKTNSDQRNTLVLYQDWNTWNDFYSITLNEHGVAKEVELSNLNELSMIDLANNLHSQQIVIVSSNPSLLPIISRLATVNDNKLYCSKVYSASSLIDSIAYKLNPGHNKRRAPANYIVCDVL